MLAFPSKACPCAGRDPKQPLNALPPGLAVPQFDIRPDDPPIDREQDPGEHWLNRIERGYAKGHRVNRAVDDHRAQETPTFLTGKTVALRVGVQSITRILIFATPSHLLTKRWIGDEG